MVVFALGIVHAFLPLDELPFTRPALHVRAKATRLLLLLLLLFHVFFFFFFDFFLFDTKRGRERNSMTGTQQSKEEEDVKEKEEEEEETCGFCAYMKGGSCKRQFVEWEKCVDDAKSKNEDFVQKCFEQTAALRECMLKDPEYYGEMDAEEEEEKEKDEEKPDEKKKKKKTEE